MYFLGYLSFIIVLDFVNEFFFGCFSFTYILSPAPVLDWLVSFFTRVEMIDEFNMLSLSQRLSIASCTILESRLGNSCNRAC